MAMAGEGMGDSAAGAPADEDKIIVRTNGTVTYTGKDIAYQLWKLGRWTATSGTAATATRRRPRPVDHHERRRRAGRARFGHATPVFNVIDVGQCYRSGW